MPHINFPADYQQVMPYLILKNAAGFMQFMKEVFGAREKAMHMRDEQTIMHGEITVGSCVIMFAEATDQYAAETGGFFIYVTDADATYALALEKGATSVMPPADQPYGRSCGVKDFCGNTWWVTSQNA